MPNARLIGLTLIVGLIAGMLLRPAPGADARSRAKGRRVLRGKAAAEVKTGWRQAVRALSFGPRGRLLAAAGDARQVLMWDLAKSEDRWRVAARGKVTALAFAPGGQHLAVSDSKQDIVLLAAATGARIRLLKGLGGRARSLAFSPDGRHLAAAGDAQRIALFDAATGRLVRSLAGHTSWVAQTLYSPDGRLVAGAGWDHTVRVWEASSGRLLCTAFGHRYALNALAFSADSRRLYSASDDHTIRMWRSDNCAFIKRVRSQPITRLALAGKRNLILGATFKGLLMFMTQQKLMPHRMIQAHRRPIDSLTISPTGRRAATGARNGEIRVWNLR